MRIVAFLKVWSGEEWIHACVESILPFVEKVVILTSDVSWIGGHGNPSLEKIAELKSWYPDRIIHLEHNEPNQLKHCDFAYQWIRENLECDYIQLIDSDELWDKAEYEKAIKFLEENPGHKAYRTQMYTYIKSPYFRIDPPEALKPVCFIRPDLEDMGAEPRGCGILPFVTMEDVWCHHFVFVRYHFNKVLEKLVQSHVSEKQPYEEMQIWIPEIWNKLPNYNEELYPKGFHPAIGFGRNWKSIKVMSLSELPEVLQQKKYRSILSYGS